MLAARLRRAGKPEIVMTLVVRDEGDIIDDMLRFHLEIGVDHILVTDNGSLDRTRDILQGYSNLGVLSLLDQPAFDHSQYRWSTIMAEIAHRELHAGWVIHADADEFFWHPQGLKVALRGIPTDMLYLEVPRHDFVPAAGMDPRNPAITMLYRKRVSLNLNGRPLPPKVIHRALQGLSIAQGNHAVNLPPASRADFTGIEVLHFPIRSYEQFEVKVRNGGESYERNATLPESVGFHKRYWYKELQAGRLMKEYEKMFVSEDRLAAKLAKGEIVVDDRVRTVLMKSIVSKTKKPVENTSNAAPAAVREQDVSNLQVARNPDRRSKLFNTTEQVDLAPTHRTRIPRARPRVLYLLNRYPQLSQTYISTEIRYQERDFELDIVAFKEAPDPDPDCLPYVQMDNIEQIVAYARSFRPDVIHTHWLVQADIVGAVSASLRVPFTVRAHSFDVIHFTPETRPKHIGRCMPYLNSELCLGVFSFPFTEQMLVGAGLRPDKFIPTGPVIDFQLFHNCLENGQGVMNTGAAVAKKDMTSFIDLANKVQEREFTLYPIGHLTPALKDYNAKFGDRVRFSETISHRRMPAEYKKQQWIVYTASMQSKNIGWPMALAEAQASGVGVCVANVRPDLRDYLGEAGYVYDSLDEVAEIVKGPVPNSMREAGFENASRFDIQRTRISLGQVWRS